MDTQLDPQLVNLAKAIRQTESGGNFQAQGKSGEYGAYQFMPSTWSSASQKYLGKPVALAQATPEQQNEVAYKQLADWKTEHPDWNVGNFASAWNAGPHAPDAYLQDHKGTNSQGVQYDTPGYAKKVAETYQQYKGQGSQQPQTDNGLGAFNSPTTQEPVPTAQPTPTNIPSPTPQDNSQSGGFLGKLASGAGDFLNNIEKPFIGAAAIPVQLLAKALGRPDPYAGGMPSLNGKQIPVTDLNLEKKAGDLAQVGSYFIPGEGILGAASMGALQGAGNAMSEGGDLGKVAVGGGIGAATGGALAGATKLAGGLLGKAGGLISGETAVKAEQGIKDAYSSALNLNASERAFEGRSGKDLAKVLVDNRAPLARNENGTLDASGAIQKLQDALDPLNAKAKEVLSNPQGVVHDINLNDTLGAVKDRIQKLSITQAEKNAAIQHATDLIGAEAKQYGNTVSPEIADQIKQGMWGSSFRGKLTTADKLQGNVSYLTGNALKDSIEKAVAGSDAGNVLPGINKQRGDLIDAVKRLTNLDGVRILKGGKLGNISGGMVGSIAGLASGTGPLGALAGDYFGTKASELLQSPAFKIGMAEKKAAATALLPKFLGKTATPVGNVVSKVGNVVSKSARPVGFMGNILTK